MRRQSPRWLRCALNQLEDRAHGTGLKAELLLQYEMPHFHPRLAASTGACSFPPLLLF